MLFEEMNLPEYLLQALSQSGIAQPTAIQERALPLVREGKDVVGKSRTGSGKTFAYGIPAIERIDAEDRATQVLVLCPTRELCMQVTEELRKLAVKKEGCRTVAVYGGTGMEKQIADLKKGARIVVGTPGRAVDHIDRRVLKLGGVKLLVLDEADEMLSMGFQKELDAILKKVNPDRQTVMFSATLPESVKGVVASHMKEPVFVEIEEALPDVEQRYVTVGSHDKEQALFELLLSENPHTALVFCNTKRMVDKLASAFEERKIPFEAIHGDIPQPKRKAAMESVKKKGGILLATDVAARGIDIKDVDVIVNFDMPQSAEILTHRIGRTARAGKSGQAVTIINTAPQKGEFMRLLTESGTTARPFVLSCSVDYEARAPRRGKFANGERTDGHSRTFKGEKNDRAFKGDQRGRRTGGGAKPRKDFSFDRFGECDAPKGDRPTWDKRKGGRQDDRFRKGVRGEGKPSRTAPHGKGYGKSAPSSQRKNGAPRKGFGKKK